MFSVRAVEIWSYQWRRVAYLGVMDVGARFYSLRRDVRSATRSSRSTEA